MTQPKPNATTTAPLTPAVTTDPAQAQHPQPTHAGPPVAATPLSSANPKGLVYGGICRFPNHPDADMHGLVRAIIRTRLFVQAIEAMARFGVDIAPRELGKTWFSSASAVEHAATEGHYGEVMVTKVATAYLRPEFYHVVPMTLAVNRKR